LKPQENLRRVGRAKAARQRALHEAELGRTRLILRPEQERLQLSQWEHTRGPVRARRGEPRGVGAFLAGAVKRIARKGEHSIPNNHGLGNRLASLFTLVARGLAPDIVPREVGGGRNARQPGQVRKEAAVTSLVSGRLPASSFFPKARGH